MYKVSVVGIGGGDIFFTVKLFSMKSLDHLNFISTIQPKITLLLILLTQIFFIAVYLEWISFINSHDVKEIR